MIVEKKNAYGVRKCADNKGKKEPKKWDSSVLQLKPYYICTINQLTLLSSVYCRSTKIIDNKLFKETKYGE